MFQLILNQSLYLDRAMYLWTFIAQNEESRDGCSIKHPSGKAEVIDESVKVSRNDHDQ